MARVLIVDDDPFFLTIAGNIVREAGFEVRKAPSAREALVLLARESCEVVVTDIVMPELSGVDLLREIKKIEPFKPVICTSALESFSTAVELVRNGAFDFLPKPIDARQLVASITSAIRIYREAVEREKLVARAQSWARELLTLRHLGESSGQDLLRNLFRKTVEAVADTIRVEVVSLMLLSGRQLTIADAIGLPADVIPKVKVEMGSGISGSVAAKGEPLLINDIAQHPLFRPSRFSNQYRTQSALCVPLKRGERVLGVINVNNKLDGTAFEQSDLDLLTTVGSQVAMAIDNARLYRDLEEKAAELARAHEELVRLDKDKTELILNVSHELKTPLTSIIGFAGLLQTLPRKKDHADFAHYADKIETAAHRLNHIVERMLELFRMEAGRVRWQKAEVAAEKEVISPVLVQMGKELAGRKVTVDASGMEGKVACDVASLRRALALVLENAVKFSPPGSPVEIAARRLAYLPPVPEYAAFAAAAAGKWVEFTVTDRGSGMKEKDIPLIFEKFRQLGDIMTEKPSGVGLGLSIARSILERHGGMIWADSRPGEGTRLHLLLPAPAEAPAGAAASAGDPPDREGERKG